MRALLSGLVVCLVLATACKSHPAERPAAQSASLSFIDSLLQAAVVASGTHLLDSATVAYRFRQNSMGYDRRGDAFVYTRTYTDSSGNTITDILSNTGLQRTVNDEPRGLSPKQAATASEQVNSVTYFALLPRFLLDPAVNASYDGLDTVSQTLYHRIRVSFAEEMGGTDFEDEFLYWFDANDLSLDFLAYAYATNGGGVRLREAFNERRPAGVRISDYRNYRADPENSVPLDGMMHRFRRGELKLLSVVALEDVRIALH